MRRLIAALAAVASLVAVATAIAAAAFPERIPLPDGYRPEGIAAGNGKTLYVGSIPTGEVRKVDAKTGDVDPLVPARPGERQAIGLKFDHGRLFVAGGGTGAGYVYDAKTGKDLAVFEFFTPTGQGSTFVNDVFVTRDAAYFTDSRRSVLYVVESDLGGFRELPLPDVPLGDGNNLNGIVATPDGKTLIAVRGGNYGELWRIDPKTGRAALIDLGGRDVKNGDGLLLVGKRTLYVVQNQQNKIGVFRLDNKLRSATWVEDIAVTPFEGFSVPTTVARLGNRLYLPGARFGETMTPTTKFWIKQVKR
jgi:sugar lactone lactonase YvrE